MLLQKIGRRFEFRYILRKYSELESPCVSYTPKCDATQTIPTVLPAMILQ